MDFFGSLLVEVIMKIKGEAGAVKGSGSFDAKMLLGVSKKVSMIVVLYRVISDKNIRR